MLRKPKAKIAALSLSLMLAACSINNSSPESNHEDFTTLDMAMPEYNVHSTGEAREAMLVLPGYDQATLVHYEVVDGEAIMEGDIILGPADSLIDSFSTQSIGRSGSKYRWPDGIIPYRINSSFGPIMRQRINDAISHWEENTDIDLQLIPGGTTPPNDWLEFVSSTVCRSAVGRQGGRQEIKLDTDCSTGTIIHEIGHTVGLWHEHSREDRDNFVDIIYGNIRGETENKNFDKKIKTGFDIRSYDYGSIMHYGNFAFCKLDDSDNCVGRTVLTKPRGIAIGQRNALSEGDLAGVMTLYPRQTFWHQNISSVPSHPGSGESFGHAVAVGDFDGNGFDDVAVSVPFQTVGGKTQAGAVHVFYGSSKGIGTSKQQFWHQNSSGVLQDAHERDQFGWSLAAGDFNGDGKDDLAIGVPFENLGTIRDAGIVQVLRGSSSGLSTHLDQILHQNIKDILGRAEQGDQFGYALTAGDFNGDGRDDLAVGVPGESVRNNSIGNAGAVNVFYGTGIGLAGNGNQLWTQDNVGTAEWHDRFGMTLSSGDFNADGKDDLAIGVPMEDIRGKQNAGQVHVLYGSSTARLSAQGNISITQNNSGGKSEANDRFGSAIAAGDFNGDGDDDLAVGAPFETVDGKKDAGVVNIVFGSQWGLNRNNNQRFNQILTGNSNEADDKFGSVLSAADFNGDGRDDLAIGVPEEDVGSLLDAGGLVILYGSNQHLTSTNQQTWHQNREGAPHFAQRNDFFASALAAGDFDNDGRADLAIGIPGEEINNVNNAGAVEIMYYFQ